MKWICLALLFLAAGGSAVPAFAHEMSMAEMQVQELAPGQFQWQWGQTEKRPPAQFLAPQWPAQCVVQPGTLNCGPEGLKGWLRMEGVGEVYSAALIRIDWLRGGSRVYTLTGGQPAVQLFGSADDERGLLEIARAYGVLGFEHILTGWDHLMFVSGLLFLVGFRRKLVLTITAFTISHSVTLACAALGWLVVRSPPVEVNIALSIMLVVAEALNPRDTLSRRWPALVAFLFGLVHGLGFGGALEEVGLPAHAVPAALFTFNMGVECGNLLVISALWLAWQGLRRWPFVPRLRTPALYTMGSVAAYWSCDRLVALFA